MKGPDPAYLGQITDTAEEWLRRCNNRPPTGILTSRGDLRIVLAASTDVHRDDRGWIVWRAGRVGGHSFSAEPVPPEPPAPPA